MRSVESGAFLLGPGMLINYLKVSEKFNYLLNFNCIFSKVLFKSSREEREECNSKNMIHSSGQGRVGCLLLPLTLSSDSSHQQTQRDLESDMGSLCSSLSPLCVLVTGHCL